MTQDRRRGLRVTVLAAMAALGPALVGLLSGGAASAQSGPAGSPLSLEEVRACLCQQRAIDDLRRETELQGALRREREAELDRVDQEIEQRRVTMDGSDPAAVQEMRRLVSRQQMLRDLLRADVRQGYRDSVERLNARVAVYNEQCTTRPMLTRDVERAKENLQCPAP